ncbi:MAG: glycosyltransferase family 2 protein [Acetobacteraceae bacterium]
MHISIITPAWNAAGHLDAAIGSVRAQTWSEWSMTVVDDGSTDGTAELARACRDPRVAVISQAHAGVSAARNRGLEECAADAVLFLDADDMLVPDALAALARALVCAPRAVAAVGAYQRVDAAGVRPRSPAAPPACGDMLERLLVVNRYANGGHVLIRADAARAVGRFRSDLAFGEDWEYWVRLALLGPFARTAGSGPVLRVRERLDGAYAGGAAHVATLRAAVDAVHSVPGLAARIGADRLRALRRRAEAELAWIAGRELVRRGRHAEGRPWLLNSVWSAPTLRRFGLLGAAFAAPVLPDAWRGPFRSYEGVPAASAG